MENVINKIIEESASIKAEKVSEEVLNWLINNVVYFIDNQRKMFKLDLIIDESSRVHFEETKRLQDLYKKIPEEGKGLDTVSEKDIEKNMELVSSCRTHLNKITKLAFEHMANNSSKLEELYKNMSYYYELKGVNKGKLLIQELAGAVAINNFEYEAFSVPVKITPKNETSTTPIKEYVIPEGFSVWVEISFKTSQTALF